MKIKNLKFNNTVIAFLSYPSMGWCIPAKLIGLALGYANEGQKLNDLITHSWNKKNWGPEDSKVFTGKELEELKKETPQYGVSLEASSVLFLSMSGVIKVLMRSRSQTANEFRNFLAKNGGELMTGHKLETVKRVPVAGIKPPTAEMVDKKFSAPLAILKQASESKAFDKQTLAQLYMELFRSSIPKATQLALPFRDVTPSKNDSTQMVPVSNIQASSLMPNFDSIRSFFLTGHQKHPKYNDWLTAEEIGAAVGKSADQVKTHSTKYVKNQGKDLSNNIAMEKVTKAGGYFRGVSTLVDADKLPCFVDEELGCLAVWYLMEDGKLVWRNYWSPKAVDDIRKLMGYPALSNGELPFPPPGATFDSPPETKSLP